MYGWGLEHLRQRWLLFMGEWNRENTNGIEETQIQFCKQVLGVNKQCPIVACRNEVIRLTLKEITNVNNVKFCMHLENKQDDHYAKQCFTNIKRNGWEEADESYEKS